MDKNGGLNPSMVNYIQPLISKVMIQSLQSEVYEVFFNYHRLHQVLPSDRWLDHDIRMIKIHQKKQETLNILRFSMELVHIFEVFNEQDLPVICLKGPVIGKKIYESMGERSFKDLDLLVPEKRLTEAEHLVKKLGYVQDAASSYDAKRAHHLVYIHELKGHIIELHWRLHPNIIDEPTFEELWESHETVRIAGTDVPCLETEELFVYLISHGSKHAWFRLRWLYDIHLFLKQPLDFARIQVRLTQRGCLDMMGQALLLRQELFEEPIPEAFLHLTTSRRSKRMTRMALRIIQEQNDPGKEDQTLTEFWLWKSYHWLIRDNSKRLIFIGSHFFPREQDQDVFPLPTILHFLYFPLRPLTWLLRRIKARQST